LAYAFQRARRILAQGAFPCRKICMLSFFMHIE
jgi:hypothetical protein